MDRRAGTGGRRYQTGPGRTYEWVCEQATGNGLLLHAIRRDRTYLRKHVLSRIVNSVAASHNRFAYFGDVPRKADARLELFLRAVQCAIRRKSRIAQSESICGCRRRHSYFRKDLRLPTQAVIER